MRPIEFRAWDEDGYMFTPTTITWGTFGDKKSIEVWNGHIFGTIGSGVVALMQFTGLLRCGWKWYPRILEVRICPHCKNARWDQPREERKRKEKA